MKIMTDREEARYLRDHAAKIAECRTFEQFRELQCHFVEWLAAKIELSAQGDAAADAVKAHRILDARQQLGLPDHPPSEWTGPGNPEVDVGRIYERLLGDDLPSREEQLTLSTTSDGGASTDHHLRVLVCPEGEEGDSAWKHCRPGTLAVFPRLGAIPDEWDVVSGRLPEAGGYLCQRVADPVPRGTTMLFTQRTAPEGWTKLEDFTGEVEGVSVVSGEVAGSGGSVIFCRKA